MYTESFVNRTTLLILCQDYAALPVCDNEKSDPSTVAFSERISAPKYNTTPPCVLSFYSTCGKTFNDLVSKDTVNYDRRYDRNNDTRKHLRIVRTVRSDEFGK